MDFLKPLALVTDVSRFDDNHIISLLLSEGYVVRIAVTQQSQSLCNGFEKFPNAASNLQFVEIKDHLSWETAFVDAQIVFHAMSGKLRGSLHEPNKEMEDSVEETKFIIDKCQTERSVQRLVLLAQTTRDDMYPMFQGNSLFRSSESVQDVAIQHSKKYETCTFKLVTIPHSSLSASNLNDVLNTSPAPVMTALTAATTVCTNPFGNAINPSGSMFKPTQPRFGTSSTSSLFQSRPSPPNFRMSSKGAQQMSKALEQQKAQSACSPPIGVFGTTLNSNDVDFVMCSGSTPCFAKIVSNATSQNIDRGNSIFVTPMILSPTDSKLLIPWKNEVWMAKKENIKPVKMVQELGGFRVVESVTVLKFIEKFKKEKCVYPISMDTVKRINRNKDDFDMISLESSSEAGGSSTGENVGTEANKSGQTDSLPAIEMELFPQLPKDNRELYLKDKCQSQSRAILHGKLTDCSNVINDFMAESNNGSSNIGSNSNVSSSSSSSYASSSMSSMFALRVMDVPPSPLSAVTAVNSLLNKTVPVVAISTPVLTDCTVPTRAPPVVRPMLKSTTDCAFFESLGVDYQPHSVLASGGSTMSQASALFSSSSSLSTLNNTLPYRSSTPVDALPSAMKDPSSRSSVKSVRFNPLLDQDHKTPKRSPDKEVIPNAPQPAIAGKIFEAPETPRDIEDIASMGTIDTHQPVLAPLFTPRECGSEALITSTFPAFSGFSTVASDEACLVNDDAFCQYPQIELNSALTTPHIPCELSFDSLPPSVAITAIDDASLLSPRSGQLFESDSPNVPFTCGIAGYGYGSDSGSLHFFNTESPIPTATVMAGADQLESVNNDNMLLTPLYNDSDETTMISRICPPFKATQVCPDLKKKQLETPKSETSTRSVNSEIKKLNQQMFMNWTESDTDDELHHPRQKVSSKRIIAYGEQMMKESQVSDFVSTTERSDSFSSRSSPCMWCDENETDCVHVLERELLHGPPRPQNTLVLLANAAVIEESGSVPVSRVSVPSPVLANQISSEAITVVPMDISLVRTNSYNNGIASDTGGDSDADQKLVDRKRKRSFGRPPLPPSMSAGNSCGSVSLHSMIPASNTQNSSMPNATMTTIAQQSLPAPPSQSQVCNEQHRSGRPPLANKPSVAVVTPDMDVVSSPSKDATGEEEEVDIWAKYISSGSPEGYWTKDDAVRVDKGEETNVATKDIENITESQQRSSKMRRLNNDQVKDTKVKTATNTDNKKQNKKTVSPNKSTTKNTTSSTPVVGIAATGRTARAAALKPVNRDACFGSWPNRKQSAATGTWAI